MMISIEVMTRRILLLTVVCLPSVSTTTDGAWVHPHRQQQRRRSDGAGWSVSGGTAATSSGDVYGSFSASSRRGSSNINSSRENILEDSSGHVNRDLAERIWNWEQEHRDEQNLPKLEYSVRSGLRLVDRSAREVLATLRGSIITKSPSDEKNSNMYSDLVQEGLMALLYAMSHYEGSDSDEFEKYAMEHIQRQLAVSLDQDTTVVATVPSNNKMTDPFLPRSVRNVIEEAKRVARTLMREQQQENEQERRRDKPPTLEQVANELDGVSLERLKDCMLLASRHNDLSIERTVQISHPTLEDSSPAYRDEDAWELSQGLLLDNGKSVMKDQLVEGYLDESKSREGDDDSWIQQQEQVAGRLQDVIPDTTTTMAPTVTTSITDDDDDNDRILEDMIREDLSGFLTSTLNEIELQVVRLAFGLDEGSSSGGVNDPTDSPPQLTTTTNTATTASSIAEMARTIGIESPDEFSIILKKAIQKLRISYTERYVEPYDNTEDDEGVGEHEEDSV